jgi:uncharacterized membrane protein YsdA (DUF1294 family)
MFKTPTSLCSLLTTIFMQISMYFSIVAMLIFASSASGFGMNSIMAFVLIFLYAIASPTTFFLYQSDKLAAQKEQQRIPEKILHIMELSGGWPGAWFAQRKFRHKISKKSYQAVFNLILIYHGSLWISFLLLKGHLGFICFLIYLISWIAIGIRWKK